jgi:tRNA(Ile)-lysidine synthase TilS/MesJ
MGDGAELLYESMMQDEDVIEEIDPYLFEGDEDFNDYALMSTEQQRDEMTRLKHNLHRPYKDDLDIVLEKTNNVFVKEINLVEGSIKNIVKKFGKPFENIEEVRAKLNAIEEQIKELTLEKGFLKQTLDNWTGDKTICPKCGKTMVKRESKFGKFLGCTGYPKCNGTREYKNNVEAE